MLIRLCRQGDYYRCLYELAPIKERERNTAHHLPKPTRPRTSTHWEHSNPGILRALAQLSTSPSISAASEPRRLRAPRGATGFFAVCGHTLISATIAKRRHQHYQLRPPSSYRVNRWSCDYSSLLYNSQFCMAKTDVRRFGLLSRTSHDVTVQTPGSCSRSVRNGKDDVANPRAYRSKAVLRLGHPVRLRD